MKDKDKEKPRYGGAETISDKGEITRPGEASVLVEEEERLGRFNRRFEAREKKPVKKPLNSEKKLKNGVTHAQPASPEGSGRSVEPPRQGEKILVLFLPKHLREYVLGDLKEDYVKIQSRHGTGFANIWYWKNVASSILLLTPRAVFKRVLSAIIGEWIRRNNL